MDWFVGLWPLVWHYGFGIGGVAGLLAIAWFVPLVRNLAVELAAVLAIAVVVYSVGVSNGENRIKAQNVAIEQRITHLAGKARDDAEAAIPAIGAPAPVPAPGRLHFGKPARPKPDTYDRG